MNPWTVRLQNLTADTNIFLGNTVDVDGVRISNVDYPLNPQYVDDTTSGSNIPNLFQSRYVGTTHPEDQHRPVIDIDLSRFSGPVALLANFHLNLYGSLLYSGPFSWWSRFLGDWAPPAVFG